MRKYIRIYKPNKRRAVIIITTKRIRKVDGLISGKDMEADDYFHEPENMEDDHVIACADLRRAKVDGRRAYYPYASFVHPDYRNQGLGILLYKACLMCIHWKMENFGGKSKPLFVQHRIGSPGASTSESARRVYKSLIKRGFLRKTADGIYNIRKFPKLKYQIIT